MVIHFYIKIIKIHLFFKYTISSLKTLPKATSLSCIIGKSVLYQKTQHFLCASYYKSSIYNVSTNVK